MSSHSSSSSFSFLDDRDPPDTASPPRPGVPGPPESYSPRAGSEELFHSPDSQDQPTFAPADAQQDDYIPPAQDRRVSIISSVSLEPRRSRHRGRHGTNHSIDDILQLFASTRRETKELRRTLRVTLEQLEQSRARADKAERYARELTKRMNDATNGHVAALREVMSVREELGMYKSHITHAQTEVDRAGQLVQDSEDRLNEAEGAAARARDVARKATTQLLVDRAKEEGRIEGFNANARTIYYKDDAEEPDRRVAQDAMAEILASEYGSQRSRTVRQDYPQYAPPTPAPNDDELPPRSPPRQMGYSPSQRSSNDGQYSTPRDPFTDTPAPRPRGAAVRRPESSSSTTTLPAAPPSAAQRAPPVSTLSPIPEVVNTEPDAASRRSSVRRSRVAPERETPRSPLVQLTGQDYPLRAYSPVPPPGELYGAGVPPLGGERDLPPSPAVPMQSYSERERRQSYAPVPPPGQFSVPRSADSVENRHARDADYFDSPRTQRSPEANRKLADSLRDLPTTARLPQSPSRNGPPPHWLPQVRMPAPLASSAQPPMSPRDAGGHRRSQSIGIPRSQGSPSHVERDLRPRPVHRRSTSMSTPNYNITVESPSDPDLSISRSPSNVQEDASSANYLSPNAINNPLPPATPTQPPQQAQYFAPPVHRQQPPGHQQFYSTPQPNQPPQRFPPTVYSEQSPVDPTPPQRFPPGSYGDPRTRSAGTPQGSPRRNGSPLPVPQPGAVPHPQRSVQWSAGASPQSATSPLPPPRPSSANKFYGGQQPVLVPPPRGGPVPTSQWPMSAVPDATPSRSASPAPLPVPSPSRNGHRLPPFSSTAGATPGIVRGTLPQGSPSVTLSGLPPGSPRVSGSPLLGPGSLYTHWDTRSVEDMGSVADLAAASAEPVVRQSGSRKNRRK